MFKRYYANVTDSQDITYLGNNKPDVTKTDHVTYANRLKGARGKIIETFESDRD